jgi:hypothetical protein
VVFTIKGFTNTMYVLIVLLGLGFIASGFGSVYLDCFICAEGVTGGVSSLDWFLLFLNIDFQVDPLGADQCVKVNMQFMS